MVLKSAIFELKKNFLAAKGAAQEALICGDWMSVLANVEIHLSPFKFIFYFYFIIYKIDKEYYEYKTTQNPRSMDLSHCSKEKV